MKVSILGAGSWGTAISVLLTDNGHDVMVWSIDKEEIKMLEEEREHKTKLPGVKIADSLKLTNDAKEAVDFAELLVMVVPSPFVRSTAKTIAPYVREGQLIVNLSKGIEESTLMAMRVNLEDQREEEIETLTKQLASEKLNSTEKNNIYEQLKYLNEIQGKEELLEKNLKKEFNLDCFVKVDTPDITTVCVSKEHDINLANKIMNSIQNNYKDKMIISVKFQKK